ncbi:hypothetical protein BU251_02475 [Candidatus Velamenicoccus archaeovorus]|uniref:Type IV conjugative transfer system protein TraL n=1 Tax=Velamenicoccus archaeovorus TaxID=1930593 RepID=A0A410P3U8_VELA1|nr:hypothetical protein [Candidatus Velamenicoccus archaeovorus]QAT16674.1 hypothetical protein BU251_02475 [Candidatus Velamenicoccus archaeovorus]
MKKCVRTIDRPLLLFDLEPEDVGILALASGFMIIFFDPFYAGTVFFGGWVAFRLVKQGKPQGYLTHLFYKHGVRIKGLIEPPKLVQRYSVFGGGDRNADAEF